MTLPDIDSSVTAPEAVRLQELATDARVLEVGSWRGFSTVAMAQVATRVDAVDWHKGDEHAGRDESLSHLIANLERFAVSDRVVVHVGRSEDVLPLFAMGYYDLAFIDAYHTVEAVRADADLVLPLVHVAGHIAFHDWGDQRFGVTAVVDALVLEGAVEWVDNVGSLAVVRKR